MRTSPVTRTAPQLDWKQFIRSVAVPCPPGPTPRIQSRTETEIDKVHSTLTIKPSTREDKTATYTKTNSILDPISHPTDPPEITTCLVPHLIPERYLWLRTSPSLPRGRSCIHGRERSSTCCCSLNKTFVVRLYGPNASRLG